jgi:hypothetical protein
LELRVRQLDNVRWSGRLEEVEFLQRLFDLQALASLDSSWCGKFRAARIFQR